MKIYFVARAVVPNTMKTTQGVVERSLWTMLKKELAADGYVVTYWNLVDDDAVDDRAPRGPAGRATPVQSGHRARRSPGCPTADGNSPPGRDCERSSAADKNVQD